MSAGLFITGTDTECGKTFVARALVRLLRDQGIRVAGQKPVAAGAVYTSEGLRNDDALQLQAESGLDLPYHMVNPYCFEPAIAPHLAAADAGTKIELAPIQRSFAALQAQAEAVIVEGAGGWLVPLGRELDMAGLAAALGLPVVLVVGLRLGCLNHARLTEMAIRAKGVAIAGWVGSQVDPQMARLDDNLATLRDRLTAPCLGVLRRGSGVAGEAQTGNGLEVEQILAAAGLRAA